MSELEVPWDKSLLLCDSMITLTIVSFMLSVMSLLIYLMLPLRTISQGRLVMVFQLESKVILHGRSTIPVS